MIDPKIISSSEGRIKLEIEDQNKRLDKNIEQHKAQMAARGMLRSGNMVMGVVEECVKAINERAEIVWSTLHRTLTTVGVNYDDTMEEQLRIAAGQYFQSTDDFQRRVHNIAELISMPNLANTVSDQISTARSSALRRINSEIELFVLALKNKPATAAPYAPQITISHANIGAFQAGHNATATITQQVRNESHEGIIKALELIEQELQKVGSIPGYNKAEIAELVSDGKNELAKPSPSLAKIKAYLPIISDSLKIVNELKPAYQTLKGAAQAIGVELP